MIKWQMKNTDRCHGNMALWAAQTNSRSGNEEVENECQLNYFLMHFLMVTTDMPFKLTLLTLRTKLIMCLFLYLKMENVMWWRKSVRSHFQLCITFFWEHWDQDLELYEWWWDRSGRWSVGTAGKTQHRSSVTQTDLGLWWLQDI